MQNLDMIMRLLKRMTPGLDAKAIATEIRERIGEELDYELEAQNQRSLARIFRGHPFIVVPEVVSELSRERVLVTEFVERRRLRGAEELARRPSATASGRSCSASSSAACTATGSSPAIRTRATSCCWRTGASRSWTSACSSAWNAEPVELELACQRAVSEGDAATLHRLLAQSGFLPEPERVDPEHLLAFIETAIWWYTTADEVVQLTPEIATQVMIESSDPRSSHFREMRHQDMRPEHLFGRRMEMLTLAVLSQLRARANWHRIAREWMYGEEPVTELGRDEAEFYAHAGVGA